MLVLKCVLLVHLEKTALFYQFGTTLQKSVTSGFPGVKHVIAQTFIWEIPVRMSQTINLGLKGTVQRDGSGRKKAHSIGLS